jgi:hypothetical protein
MRNTSRHLTFQLYRQARQPDRCCAVLEDNMLPSVFDPNEWAPAEVLEAGHIRPPGFNEDAAEYACSVQGFYVFRWSGKKRKAAP